MQRSRKIRQSKRQKAWQYMRRNPIFAVNDILILLEMSERSLMEMMRQLSHAEYVKQISGGKVFRKRVYKLLRNTGVICPQWIDKQHRLYDPNIQEMKVKDVSTPLPVTVTRPSPMRKIDPVEYDMGRIEKLLESEPEGLTLLLLKERSGIPPGRFASVLTKMRQEGRVVEAGKKEGVPVYIKERRRDEDHRREQA